MSAPTADEALRYMYNADVLQHIDLSGPWRGWKIRGMYLISPDRERVPVRELVGMVFHYRAKFRHARGPKLELPDNVISLAELAARRSQRLEVPSSASAGAGVQPPRGPKGRLSAMDGALFSAVGTAPYASPEGSFVPAIGRRDGPIPADPLFFVSSGEQFSRNGPLEGPDDNRAR